MQTVQSGINSVVAFGILLLIVAVAGFVARKRWADRAIVIAGELHWEFLTRLGQARMARIAAVICCLYAAIGLSLIALGLAPPAMAVVLSVIDNVGRWIQSLFAGCAGNLATVLVGLAALSTSLLGLIHVVTVRFKAARAEQPHRRAVTARRYIATFLPLTLLGALLGMAFIARGFGDGCGW